MIYVVEDRARWQNGFDHCVNSFDLAYFFIDLVTQLTKSFCLVIMWGGGGVGHGKLIYWDTSFFY